MKLAHYGEDRLIATLTRRLELGAKVRVGPGDDCAVLGPRRAVRWQLLKADAVVEGVHFLSNDDPRRVGWKALCRALSDIAAMGGVPEHALITLAVSREVEVSWVEALYAGLRRAARKFGVSIVGGETSRSPGPLFVSVTIAGWVERSRCVLRSGGRAGDVLCVTGRLGGSRAGKHLDFTPRLAEARWLVAHFKPHALMDVSDGLAADLPRLAKASGCGFILDPAHVPITRGCTLAQALSDGEDFELLFALPPQDAAGLEREWRRTFPRLPLSKLAASLNAQRSTLNFPRMATTILSTPEDTIAFGRSVAESLEAGAVLALCGELGSGKTHFVKGLAEGLGVESEATSPTFTLIHEYRSGRLPLYHVDWYRLDNATELTATGFDDCLAGNGVVAVEWADKFPEALPPGTRWLRFRYREDGTREVGEE